LAAQALDIAIDEIQDYQVSTNEAGEAIVYPQPVYG